MLVPFRGKVVGAPSNSTRHRRCKGTEREIEDLNHAADYAAGLGWNVIFEKGGEDGITPALRNITINASNTRKSQTFALLHECGHAALFENREEYHRRYPDGYIRYAMKINKSSNRHKVDVLREEIAAWDEAEKIGESLGLRFTKRDFLDERNRSLMTYIEWFK